MRENTQVPRRSSDQHRRQLGLGCARCPPLTTRQPGRSGWLPSRSCCLSGSAVHHSTRARELCAERVLARGALRPRVPAPRGAVRDPRKSAVHRAGHRAHGRVPARRARGVDALGRPACRWCPRSPHERAHARSRDRVRCAVPARDDGAQGDADHGGFGQASAGATRLGKAPGPLSSGRHPPGRKTRKLAPPPGRSSTHARPPWSSANRFTSESPTPTPGECSAAEPGSLAERFEDLRLQVIGDPRSIVVHHQQDAAVPSLRVDPHRGLGRRMADRVRHQVLDDPFDLGGVHADLDRLGVDGHRTFARVLRLGDPTLHELPQVHVATLRRHDPPLETVEVEEVAEQPLELACVRRDPSDEVEGVLAAGCRAGSARG